MDHQQATTAKVAQFYDGAAPREWERLERHRTEFALTLRALQAHLPPPPGQIIDIGGGPGRYAIALAHQGYHVTLFDLSQGLLDWARSQAEVMGAKLADYVHGNALHLGQFADGVFDAVLLMGPLYHLLTVEERTQAVREAARVLRPGGLVFASFIMRYAAIRWAAKERPDWIVQQREQAEVLLTQGLNLVPSGGGFTDSYLALPTEIRPFMEGGGFETLDVVACEGVISMIEEPVNGLTGELWTAWVDLNYRLSRDPSIHGAAEHLLYVGRKRVDQPQCS